jgi:hypothetical protein
MNKYASTAVYGNAVGPLGFPMRSDVASEIDSLIKTLDSDCRKYIDDHGGVPRRLVAEKAQTDEGERADVSVVTSEAVDRDSEVMLARGADWGQFRKNPVVTFAHDYRALPVGRAAWVKRQQNPDRWIAKTLYSRRPEDWPEAQEWFPDAVWHMVNEGTLRGKSVGFIPTEISPPTEDDLKSRPDMAAVRAVIRKYTVIEYAVAPVQSNPEALVTELIKAKAKGIDGVGVLEERLGLIIPDLDSDDAERSNGRAATRTETNAPIDRRALASLVRQRLKRFDPETILRESIREMRGQLD